MLNIECMFWPLFKQFKMTFLSILPLLVDKHIRIVRVSPGRNSVVTSVVRATVNRSKWTLGIVQWLVSHAWWLEHGQLKGCDSFPGNYQSLTCQYFPPQTLNIWYPCVPRPNLLSQCTEVELTENAAVTIVMADFDWVHLIHADQWLELSLADIMLHP